MSGYKSMLRDRVVTAWDLGLLYCKAKTRWINYVYDLHLRKLDKKERSRVCRYISGMPVQGVSCSFWGTIDPDGLLQANNPEAYEYWNAINTWVKWFQRNLLFIRTDIDRLTRSEFINKYNIDTELFEFLTDHYFRYYHVH